MKTIIKVLATALVLVVVGVTPLFAEKSGIKIGVVGGYPIAGATVGWRPSRDFETNVNLGLDYGSGNYFGISANALFTLTAIKIESATLPLTFGPEVYMSIGENHFDLGALALLRLEWTPLSFLNFFIEGGAGLEIIDNFSFQGSGKVGIRFVL